MSIQALRERRNHLAAEARKLMDSTENKKWEPEHQSKYDELTGEIVEIDAKLERHQNLLNLEADKKFDELFNRKDANRAASNDPLNERTMLNAWLRNGDKGLSAEQAVKIHNTMSTTTGSEGGYTVPTEVASSIIDAMKELKGMRDVASHLVTASGNNMSFPTSDGTAEEGEILAENATATDADPTFGTVSLNVFKYSSKVIAVPFELLQDSAIDVESFVRNRIAQRIERVTNKHFTTGTGTGQPNGIVTAASNGKVGLSGQTTTVIYDDLADLVESVDEAYLQAGSPMFMFHQQIRKVLRKLKDTAGRPIWTPGYELGITAKTPDLLLGYGVKINNHMPTPAANAKSIAFGDLSKYMIRDAMQFSLFRFSDSAYAKKGQVGFLAFARAGGNLLDTAAVKLYVHSAT